MAELTFDCTGARAERYAVIPSLTLTLRISEVTGQQLAAIALRCQFRIEPVRRQYSATEAERLNDLFGDTERWADTLRPLQFCTLSVMVPGFSGSTDVELAVPFSYDLEIGATRYFASLDAGDIPLLLLFSGTVFAVSDGRMQVQQVPWSKELRFRLPVSIFREAVDAHFPNSAWVRLSRLVLDDLLRFKSRYALPTWDATLTELLKRAAEPGDPRPPAEPADPGPPAEPSP